MIIGLDMGGTHVDAVIIENGEIITSIKKNIDREDIFQSIWSTLKELLPDDRTRIRQVNLSTTISTNAIVEDKTSPVAMFIQSGPGLPHDFLACGEENIFLSGYIDHRGEEIQPIDHEDIKSHIQNINDKNIKACGVVTKFSTRNPLHEINIAKYLKPHIKHSTLGHTMSGQLNFPRRVNTTYLNAAVHETFQLFANHIKHAMKKEGLENTPLFVLKADGGTISLEGAEKMPVETILSGPAASFQGMNALLNTEDDAILMDIGGTTTDIFFLADGVPLFEPQGIKINDFNTLVRSIYSYSIGIGGDSQIQVLNGEILIGPKRLGPPAALGGSNPTPTDAMITLGKLSIGDHTKAHEAISKLGEALKLTTEEAATKVLQQMAKTIHSTVNNLLKQINSQPVYTIEELLSDQKTVPKTIHLIGGPVKVLAPFLEKEFDLPTFYPDNHNVANAVGAALSRTTSKVTLVADTTRGQMSVPELGIYRRISRNYTLSEARQEALELLVTHAKTLGATDENIETEIIQESSFNMVRGFTTSGYNHRVEAQIRPGLIEYIGGMNKQ